jgi:hypothetical protein
MESSSFHLLPKIEKNAEVFVAVLKNLPNYEALKDLPKYGHKNIFMTLSSSHKH